MGLLDSLFGGDPGNQALTATALGLLGARGPSTGAALSNAGLLGMQAYQQAQQQQQERSQAEQMAQYRAQQMAAGALDMKEKSDAQAQRAQLQSIQQKYLKPEGFDYQGYANELASVDPMASLSLKKSLISEKPKIKEFREVRGADGNVSVVGFDEYGNVVDTRQTPFKAPEKTDFGGYVGGIDPITGRVIRYGEKTMTPGEIASNKIAGGQLAVARDRLNLDKQTSGNNLNKAPSGYRWKADGSLEAIPGGPAENRLNTASSRIADANDVISILDMAKPLVTKATSSFFGRGLDLAGQAVGLSSDSADAAAQLTALEGALVSKMPKMSGPQSDKDVLLYKQMAGRIGDPTVPASQKLAAMDSIRKLNQKYLGPNNGANDQQPGARPSLDSFWK
jgi:hypothetical protein